jgi:hypothetical protein
MKTKLLAMMLLAGGSMFAQTRFSIGIGFGGHGEGNYQPPSSYASNRFNDGDDRQGFTRGFQQDRYPGSVEDRNFRGHESNQNRENNSRSNGQDNRQENDRAYGFRYR